ncbi:nitrilase [Tardibacter chloracetimidivorans]|uniref:Nitrilase n=1 Tax=Tardibacter chloracetimidivorans TaxID=1921510 RepID=A0A1L3ZVB0_9SPHN|nr:carbon-nitrogen hydrolase family protein [Tardibacter chloracetimidivorans]API59563.1 nitrilase [Tardibacter chloracetimidivorans]
MRAAIIQTTSGIDPAANVHDLVQALAKAAGEGAEMAFTPEMCGMLDGKTARIREKAVTEADDPVLAAVRQAAASHGLWVHLGSLALKEEGADRLVNRGFVIDADGEIRARYDKIHLFDVDLPSGERYRESATYRAGERADMAETPWFRMGMSICYDVRFAGLYQQLTDAGATLLSVPAAFTATTGEAHWHVLLRARAIEAGVFVVAAAQTGRHEDGRSTYGHSLVIDPWGEVLLDMGTEPGVALCEIDMAQVEDVRGRVPAIRHRRRFSAPVQDR